MKQSFLITCLLAVLCSVSCQKKESAVAPTTQSQNTQIIWTQDLSGQMADDVEIDSSQNKDHTHSVLVGLEEEMECKVMFTSVSGSDNGLYIQKIQVEAPTGTSYSFSAEPGNPYNKGTLGAPIMSMQFLIQFQHNNGRKFGAKMVEVSGDGSITFPTEE
jgi:hypothetical protein